MYMELVGTVEVVQRRAACSCIPQAGLGQLCFRQAEATARPPQYAQAWLLQRCRPLWEPPCPCTRPGPPPSSPPHVLPLPFCQAACSTTPSIFCGICTCLPGDMSASKRSISEATVVGPEYLQSARWMGRHPHRSTLQQGAADLYSMLGTQHQPASRACAQQRQMVAEQHLRTRGAAAHRTHTGMFPSSTTTHSLCGDLVPCRLQLLLQVQHSRGAGPQLKVHELPAGALITAGCVGVPRLQAQHEQGRMLAMCRLSEETPIQQSLHRWSVGRRPAPRPCFRRRASAALQPRSAVLN